MINLTQRWKYVKPYYFTKKDDFDFNSLDTEVINVFVGRRFSGKTLFAYEIIEHFEDRKKYFISSEETIADKNIISVIKEHSALIIFDTNSITEEQVTLICKEYGKEKVKTNIICVLVSNYDDIINIISYSEQMKQIQLDFKGYLTSKESERINEKLNNMGILAFDKKRTILDNTLRIANKLDRSYLDKYAIVGKKELVLLIWLAVNKKAYLEEIFALKLYNSYQEIVTKFSPILEIESSHVGEEYEHSTIKIVCNAPIALLQIINNYTYPRRTAIGNTIKKEHFDKVCSAIYSILIAYEKCDESKVKKFLMFDTLNDVFSRQYAKENIENLIDDNYDKKSKYGAAALIQAIYENPEIQKLKSGEPNYWLQRAKSLYIINSGKNGKIERLKEGIEWAQLAAGDSETLINNGKYKYYRTLSNAIVQIAMLYGKLAYRLEYEDVMVNTQAIHYYYKGLSDGNNISAAKSLIEKSKGTKDFKNLLEKVKVNIEYISRDVIDEANYLCNIPEYSNGIIYHLK